eukprot:CAMPEP_0177348024 /NCGR_PEP_ID=MMETSP0368-20130122/30038_1 /TAXON_ID=447022 ORGANISM="Scrippsiella hangoei-like, Strain SHHI-4" /NCGR_SAMPLE_ID=MMETSP0368 /ASSEMBLY_ACC=CAM_ASM_000363 /LENGTH=152 /DNA_ID=CAMNT_0018809795 /DNA_START=842 /DNA_END=1297 /DNA_ORIENTATION=-
MADDGPPPLAPVLSLAPISVRTLSKSLSSSDSVLHMSYFLPSLKTFRQRLSSSDTFDATTGPPCIGGSILVAPPAPEAPTAAAVLVLTTNFPVALLGVLLEETGRSSNPAPAKGGRARLAGSPDGLRGLPLGMLCPSKFRAAATTVPLVGYQ